MKEKCALIPVDNELLKVKKIGGNFFFVLENLRFLNMEDIPHKCTL
jgi:hypothetical protein